jgi:hypothetical protein
MGKRRFFAAALCAAVFAGGSVSAALAGEVKGPPGSAATAQPGGNPNSTGAVGTANSACAASGLNDFDSTDPGQNVSQVQTAAACPRAHQASLVSAGAGPEKAS